MASISRLYRKGIPGCDEDFVVGCCQQLVARNETRSDLSIQHLVRLAMLSRRVGDTFSYYKPRKSKIVGEGAISVLVDLFKRELAQLEQSIRDDALEQGKAYDRLPLFDDIKL